MCRQTEIDERGRGGRDQLLVQGSTGELQPQDGCPALPTKAAAARGFVFFSLALFTIHFSKKDFQSLQILWPMYRTLNIDKNN